MHYAGRKGNDYPLKQKCNIEPHLKRKAISFSTDCLLFTVINRRKEKFILHCDGVLFFTGWCMTFKRGLGHEEPVWKQPHMVNATQMWICTNSLSFANKEFIILSFLFKVHRFWAAINLLKCQFVFGWVFLRKWFGRRQTLSLSSLQISPGDDHLFQVQVHKSPGLIRVRSKLLLMAAKVQNVTHYQNIRVSNAV